MLHPSSKGDHGQVVGIGNIVDVAGKTHRKLGERDKQRITAPSRGSLDVHRWSPRGLADTAADIPAPLAHALHKPAGGGTFPLTQWGGGDGGNLNIFAVRLILEAVNNLHEIKLGDSPVRKNLVFL
ncbi:hypothetical protein ES703_90262 [subsurface metagenome]